MKVHIFMNLYISIGDFMLLLTTEQMTNKIQQVTYKNNLSLHYRDTIKYS